MGATHHQVKKLPITYDTSDGYNSIRDLQFSLAKSGCIWITSMMFRDFYMYKLAGDIPG